MIQNQQEELVQLSEYCMLAEEKEVSADNEV